MLVDSHCHLDFPELSNRLPEILRHMQDNGVGIAVCVGVNLEGFPRVLALAEEHRQLYATVGVHPEYIDAEEPSTERLCELAGHPKVIAIGETGLDYYWQKDRPEWQRERFRTHIRAARQCKKPLVVHMRNAASDTLTILKEEGADEVGGVMHCFTEDWQVARAAIDLNFHISFSGIITFKNALALKEVACKAPLDRILVETDSPYLAPVPFRGKINEPAYVRYVALEIARGNPMKNMKKAVALLLAVALPHISLAATYDDLLNSAKTGDTSGVRQLVEKGASANTTDRDGNTLMMLAARDGYTELVDYLIKQRASINARNASGDTALGLASLRGHLDPVKLLVSGGANLNPAGWTPLAYAAFNGHPQIAEALIKAGANVNAASENGSTPLIVASRGGHIEVVKLLLANKADPNLKLESGLTALDVALAAQNTDIGDLLRQAGGKSGKTVTIQIK
ncbi:hypothetical protein B566_EDAN005695 [Ephemera danica]|nr:hypothetical protein B566_EDAN005695 [Ephemera danica]